MRWLATTALTIGTCVPVSLAQEVASRPGAAEARGAARLDARIEQIDFSHAPLDQVIEFLARQSGLNLHV